MQDEPNPRDMLHRSRRFYSLWGICISALLALGLLCWAVVVPVMETHKILGHYAVDRISDEAVVKELGGAREAARKMRIYRRMPSWLASRKDSTIIPLGNCGRFGVPALGCVC